MLPFLTEKASKIESLKPKENIIRKTAAERNEKIPTTYSEMIKIKDIFVF